MMHIVEKVEGGMKVRMMVFQSSAGSGAEMVKMQVRKVQKLIIQRKHI